MGRYRSGYIDGRKPIARNRRSFRDFVPPNSAPIRRKDYITWNGSYVKQIMSVGLPAAGEHLSWQSQYLMIISFVNMIGVTALNTHVYVMNVSNYFMALAMAIGAGTEIIVGQMVGAGEMKAAYRETDEKREDQLRINVGHRRYCSDIPA